MSSTPLSRENRRCCDSCDEPIPNRDLKRTVTWGFWDIGTQYFEREPNEDHYCEACWRSEFDAPSATRYEVDDPETLWNLLDASDGTLVADCKPVFVGGRPYVRVVDEFVQVLHYRQTVDRVDDVVRFRSELVQTDMSREEFMQTFTRPAEGPPVIVYLRHHDDTPFAEFKPRDGAQQTLIDE